MLRPIRTVLVCFLTGVFLVGCTSGTQSPTESTESAIVLSSSAAPKSFNPVTAKETSTTQITNLMFSGLVDMDGESGKIVPGLAKNWTSNQEGRVWEFTLRDGLKWSDGHPIDASDVVFTFEELHLNPEVNSSARFILQVDGELPEVEALSETRIRFTYSKPYAPFLRAVGVGIMPEHVLGDSVENGTFNSMWGVGTDPDSFVVNGPFELKEYQTAQRVILTRNDNYYKTGPEGEELPRLEQVTYEIVKNRDIALQKFLNGELDVLNVQAKNLPNIQPREQGSPFSLYRVGPARSTTFLSFNMNTDTNPKTGTTYIESHKLDWFNDPAFRRAVSYGIARKEIINIVLNGNGFPLYGPISPGNKLFYNDNIKQYPHDSQTARRILSENGYVDRDDDGIREGPDGHPLEFVLNTNSGNDQRVEMTEIIRQDLDNLGMDVSFSQVEFNTLTTKLNATFDWEAIVIGFTGSIDPHLGSNLWRSSADLHIWHPRQDHPHREWEADIDRIFSTAVTVTDPEQRKKLYDRWQMIVSEVQPVIYTVTPEVIYAIRDRLTHVNPTPIGGFDHNIEEIGVKH